jgi:hypothetical protein
MKYHAALLSDKLRAVLEIAQAYEVEEKTKRGLAELIFESRRIEFSYAYRASDGEIRRGYITPTKIEKYISFLQEIRLLNEDLSLKTDPQLILDEDAFDNFMADTAKDILSENGIGVQKVAEAASKILKDENGTLPTLDEIFDALGTDLAKWRFRWLISLYSLGSTSLLRFRQSPLLLPRKYTRAG